MKKLLVFLISLFLFLPIMVSAEGKKINIHLFYSSTCPHCSEEKEYLNELTKNDKNIKV